jgi:Uma2 family endonuclease
MSTAYTTFTGPPEVGPITLPLGKLTSDQYLRMIDAGILQEDDRVELIGGVITEMSPAGPDHVGTVYILTDLFAKVIDRFVLSVQCTVVIAEGHVFDPDVALLRRKPDGYRKALPRAEDIALLIEVAATSYNKDRHLKLPVYSSAGIKEYWIVDLTSEKLLVFRDPQGDAFRTELQISGDQTISPLACPDLGIRVSELFA